MKSFKEYLQDCHEKNIGFTIQNGEDFIDYDDDLDIGIWHKDSYKLLNALPELKKHGFEIALIRLDNSFIIPYSEVYYGKVSSFVWSCKIVRYY